MKDKEKQYISMKEMLKKRSIEPITNCNCRKNKEGAFVDLLNKEIEELQKARAIEEMAEIIQSYSDIEQSYYDGKWHLVDVYTGLAKTLYNKDFRIVNEDSVVLSREELNEIINQTKEIEKNYYKKVVIPQSSKETAEKIYNFVERYIMDDYEVELTVKEWFKEEFGIEIKE